MKYPQVIDVKIFSIVENISDSSTKNYRSGRTIGMLLLILTQSLPFNSF